MDIPTAKEMRVLSKQSAEVNLEVEESLRSILSVIESKAREGSKSVFIEGDTYYNYNLISPMDKVFERLLSAGYAISKQTKEEREYTCFGVCEFTTKGVLIRW